METYILIAIAFWAMAFTAGTDIQILVKAAQITPPVPDLMGLAMATAAVCCCIAAMHGYARRRIYLNYIPSNPSKGET